MATIDFNNKDNFKSPNVFNAQQVHHQQIIIDNPRNINLSYCEVLQKNKPQSNSVGGGVFLLIVSGLHIGWGIWRNQLIAPWAFQTSQGIIMFALMSWYVFAVIGSIVGAVLVTIIRKKFIYYIGGVLLIVSNILFIALYKEHEAIIVGRCLAGLAHGIIYNATITHAAENVIKDIRGMLLSTISCIMLSGVFVSTALIGAMSYDYDYSVTSDFIFGIVGLVLSVLGIVCATFQIYESIPFLLRRNNETEATSNLLKLRNESVMTSQLANDLDEMRLMVAQDKQDNQNILTSGNASATGKMVVLRVLSTLTNNFIINTLLISMVSTLLNPYNVYGEPLAPMVLSGSRVAASFIPVFSTDFFRRKTHLTVSSATSGILLLIIAIIIAAINYFTTSNYWVLGVFAIIFQIFVSIGIDPMQHLLLSEAFSTSKKAWSIALVTTIEYLLQILFIGLSFLPIDRVRILVILFVTAGIMLPLALFLQLALPETFKKSIKETRDLFYK